MRFHATERVMTGQILSEAHRGNLLRERGLPPLCKWPGGKEHELASILPLIPPFSGRYIEPFVGAGAVFFWIEEERQKLINDCSTELISLYRMVACQQGDFFRLLDTFLSCWRWLGEMVENQAEDLVSAYKAYSDSSWAPTKLDRWLLTFLAAHEPGICDLAARVRNGHGDHLLREMRIALLSKITRMRRIEEQKNTLSVGDILANIESALKSAFYIFLRSLYNHRDEYRLPHPTVGALFYFLREHAYASMFRYNRRGEFNVPYGGLSYNRKDMAKKVAGLRSPEMQRHLARTVIENLDFEQFLEKFQPKEEDFLLIDPPYDTPFRSYTGIEFTKSDQKRLAFYLLRRCTARFLLIVKKTPLMLQLYGDQGLFIQALRKKYMVSFQDRNERDVEHLLISNYCPHPYQGAGAYLDDEFISQ
jgi:DNA adenine methylase